MLRSYDRVVMRDWRRLAVLTMCAAYALFCLVTMPGGALTSPDSTVYLSFLPIVPLAYPAFLKLTGERGAMILQPLIYASALAWLGIETLLTTVNFPVAAAVVLGAIAIPDLAVYHASILTESLFMSALVAMIAAAIRFARLPDARSAAVAATLAGLASTLRSTGYAFLPVLIVMVLMQRRQLRHRLAITLLAAVLPMAVLAGGERIAARMIHGDRLLSLTGRHLYAKAALVDAPPGAASYGAERQQLSQQLDVDYASIRRAISGAPADTRGVLTLYYETCLQGPCVAELGESRPGTESPALASDLFTVARERIMRSPLNFARVVATDYTSLWGAYKQRHPDTAVELNAWVAANRPLPFERQAFRLQPGDPPPFQASGFVRVIQPMVIAVGWITGGLALLGLGAAATGRPMPASLTAACVAALAAHSGLLVSATFAAGIGRFVVGFWPAVATAVILAAAPLFRFSSAERTNVAV